MGSLSGESLVGLISSYVSLRHQGQEYIGLCPFHNERTPSFTVVPKKDFSIALAAAPTATPLPLKDSIMA